MKGKVIKKYEKSGESIVEINVSSELKNKTITTQGSGIIAFTTE